MIDWLIRHGVILKTEKDGRMFPTTDKSQTIIDCLLQFLEKQRVVLSLESEATALSQENGLFSISLRSGEVIIAKKVLLATGGIQRSYFLAENLGHSIEPAIPSLFTFEIKEDWIKAYSGSVATSACVTLEGFNKETKGPVLITHWGLSGPAVLKLSAFAARWLFHLKYEAKVMINWVQLSKQQVQEALFGERKKSASKKLFLTPLFSLSKNFWKALLTQVSPDLPELPWAKVSKEAILQLAHILTQTELSVIGKSTNKEEFVTCGGVCLKEVDPKTFQSKKVPGLYFAGELLDIDGVTGGFNFQNAWSSGYLAALSMVSELQ
jgi:predicted Rossmann fold flavoprotein